MELCLTLYLDEFTPVINALFNNYKYHEDEIEEFGRYSLSGQHEAITTWPDIIDNLKALGSSLGLTLPDPAYDPELGLYVCAKKDYLQVIDTHFNGSSAILKPDKSYDYLVSNIQDLHYSPSLDDLFNLACRWNDGHGLQEIEFSYHFDGRMIYKGYVGQQWVKDKFFTDDNLGTLLNDAISSMDISQAAELLKEHLDDLIVGVRDANVRHQLLNALGLVLTS